MALIYASAVNKRMHQLQKKRSMEFLSQPNEAALSTSLQRQQSLKKRNPQQEDGPNIGGGRAEKVGRENGGEPRKRSAPPSANRHCLVQSNSQPAPQNGNINSRMYRQHSQTEQKQLRKLTVAYRQLSAEGDDDKELVRKGHPRLRKISTASMTASMRSGSAEGGTDVRETRKQRHKKGSEESTPDRTSDALAAQQRRRSISMDETMFRGRAGTSSSLELAEEANAAGGVPSRKSSALERMRKRLNKWKLTGWGD